MMEAEKLCIEQKKIYADQFCDKKNLISLATTSNTDSIQSNRVSPTTFRKPPMAPFKSFNLKTISSFEDSHTEASLKNQCSGPRVRRSASTGRDKRSELQARYWALLFGNLQRAVNEIYQTVECYENISSCQEAILVLENYVRDFKALSEWFKVSWDYESKSLQQRPHSLAWEIRKSNPMPRVRTKSLTSPTISGKSSPCLCRCNSGKSSPCCDFDAVSPRKGVRVKVRDLFSSKRQSDLHDLKRNQFSQTELEDDHLTLADLRERMRRESEECAKRLNAKITPLDEKNTTSTCLPQEASETDDLHELTSVEMTVKKLNDMENEVLAKISNKQLVLSKTEPNQLDDLVGTGVKNTKIVTTQAAAQNIISKYAKVANMGINKSINSKTNTLRTTPVAAPLNKVAMKPKVLPNPRLRQNFCTTVSAISTMKTTIERPNIIHGKNKESISSRPKSDFLGPPTNVATRLSARSRTMTEMKNNNIKNSVQRVRSAQSNSINANTLRKNTREDFENSKSTSQGNNERASVNRNNLSRAVLIDDRRSEPKQLPSESNDGWLTVKNRRRSSMHWSNRFNQPTGYASLPTLVLLEEKSIDLVDNCMNPFDTEIKGNTDNLEKQNPDNIMNEQTSLKSVEKSSKSQNCIEKKVSLRPQIKNVRAKVNSLPVLKKMNINSAEKTKKTSHIFSIPNRFENIKRQKSDITGLKLTSLHREFKRNEMKAQRIRNGDTLFTSSSSTSISTARNVNSSTETVIEVNNHEIPGSESSNLEGIDQNKIDIKIQTNCDFSKTIGDLYESLPRTTKAMTAFVNGLNSGETLSSCDETEENSPTDNDCDEDQRKLVEEQESLERQIRELENSVIEVDTETDETDYEVILESENDAKYLIDPNDFDDSSTVVFVPVSETEDDPNISLESRYRALLSDMSRGEREEALATLQAYVSRYPGRAQELHQKLSSPSRRRSLQETLKKYQAKQARAQQKRELLQKEKSIKIQQLLARVEDVKQAKLQLIEDKRLKMEDKMQRAAENREMFLKQIVEKAHDEEKKLKEINFIKNIEAQNKRLDLMESSKDAEVRLQDLEQERQKRLEEKAAKEAAVERRKQALEEERQRKLEKMNESRLEKEQRIGKMQEQKELQRQALAREKARDREERLLALQAYKQQTTEQLQRKILQKQKESARRHEENIEHIRQRALELSVPLRNVDENNQQRSENDEDGERSSTLSDVSTREHTRGFKKKLKKLKHRLFQSAEEYIKELQPVPLHMKRESQVPKYLNLIAKGGGAQGLERVLGNLLRLMSKAQVSDFQCFYLMDGLGIITQNVVLKCADEDVEISKKSVVLAVQLYRNTCSLCPQIARHALLGNSIIAMYDTIIKCFQLTEEKSPQQPVELSTELMLACAVAMTPSYYKKHTNPKILGRIPDLISYAVATGLLELLSRRCMSVHESIENNQSVVLSMLAILGLLTKFLDLSPQGSTDSTRILSTAKSTELFGSISMLYSCVVPIGEIIPARTISLAASTFNLIVSLAVLDLQTFQDIMSDESVILRFLDVVAVLLKYCGNKNVAVKNTETQAVAIDLIASIGFLCVNNEKNQNLLTSEQCSLIIKSLTKLPENFNMVVYPCLVTITFQNQPARNVISRDFNIDFLDEYSRSEKAKKNHLIGLLKETEANT